MHQGDRAGQRRANTADDDDAADPGRPHRVAHQADVQRLHVRRAAVGPLPDVAYEPNAALVMCQAALAMRQPAPMRGSARGPGRCPGLRHVRRQHAHWRVPPDTDLDRVTSDWVELQHAIVDTLGAIHGVVVTATNAWVMNAELSLSVTSLEGKLMHPDPAEISSYGVQRSKLGAPYIRKPRWGTYLSPSHVAAVGGRDKIVAVVQPAVVRDVGELLYVQLTERVSDATGPDARARYRAFVDLVAPITMPLLPS